MADPKLGAAIAKKVKIQVQSDSESHEWIRAIRAQLDELITGLPQSQLTAMSLGLAHSLSRYKLKFSPDKVDTMIIQAIALLDDLDKEVNTYAMRLKEWFGWHFPEMTKVVTDSLAYANCVLAMKSRRENCSETDFSTILSEEIEKELKDVAEVSMGTEIADEDIISIMHLADQIVELMNYRANLHTYLQSRMQAIAPNLTQLVGDLVGARLIAHAGSLMNLAKHPASTVQILGAEKALFRALKAKKDTPKYGLIYHASLVGQAGQKNKGKMARMVAAKAALATRVDALTESTDGAETPVDTVGQLGLDQRVKLENQLRRLEGRAVAAIPKPVKQTAPAPKIQAEPAYNPSADNVMVQDADDADKVVDGNVETADKADKPKKKKRKSEDGEEPKKKKKHKHE